MQNLQVLLATNNDGSGRSRGGNAKYRSHNRKVQRRRVAEQMLEMAISPMQNTS